MHTLEFVPDPAVPHEQLRFLTGGLSDFLQIKDNSWQWGEAEPCCA